jgi:hypothetical protein
MGTNVRREITSRNDPPSPQRVNCSGSLPFEGDIPNRSQVNLAVNCELIPFGSEATPTNVTHWRYDNANSSLATAAIIVGPMCDTIQSAGVGRIDLVLGCDTVLLQ